MKQYRASDLGNDIAQVERNVADFRGPPILSGNVIAGIVGRIPVAVARAKDDPLYGIASTLAPPRGGAEPDSVWRPECRLT